MEPATSERNGVLSERTLVLNRVWSPVHITSVRRALVMMYHRAALAVCPSTYETHDFASWTKVEAPNGARVVRTVLLAF
jgi:hypothetical protein